MKNKGSADGRRKAAFQFFNSFENLQLEDYANFLTSPIHVKHFCEICGNVIIL